jgi:hypothetical protein
LGLSSCGGAKVLKQPEPLVVTRPLSTDLDETLSATLDWVIFRDGPGTWAKNVDWDEYMLRVKNLSDEALQITRVRVVDSLGTPIEPGQTRKQLIKGSKEAKRRYKGEGLKIKAGLSGGVLVGAGVVAAAGTSGVGAAAIAGGGVAMGAAAVVVFVPVMAVGGLIRGVNNSRVNSAIESRQTILPIVLQEQEQKQIDLFFPLTPSPRQIEFTYVDARGDHELVVNTQVALDGLHIVPAEK